MSIDFLRVCELCDEEIQGVSDGEDEILDVCTGCGCIEGETYSLYEDDDGNYTIDSRLL